MERGNITMALAVAAELRQPLALENALALTALFARTGDERFERAAARWVGRLATERDVTLAQLS